MISKGFQYLHYSSYWPRQELLGEKCSALFFFFPAVLKSRYKLHLGNIVSPLLELREVY